MTKPTLDLPVAAGEGEETTAPRAAPKEPPTPLELDPREAVEQILAAAQGIDDPTSLLAMLAEKAPIALAEVCCGARAPGGPLWVRAALAHATALESQLSPRGAWGRLVELAGDAGQPDGAAMAALRVASERHPAAGWLLKLSRKVEGAGAGFTHLVASAAHPSFAQSCFVHAEAGHIDGLVRAAAATGRPEPAAALVETDANAAARAAGAALDADDQCPIVAHLASVFGPEPDLLVAKVVPHLRRRAAAEALLAQSAQLPHTARVLRAVIPGMAR